MFRSRSTSQDHSSAVEQDQTLFSILLGVGVGGAIGLLSAVVADQLKQKLFGPKLRLEFAENEGFIARTTETVQIVPDDPEAVVSSKAIYLRVKATNTRKALAKKCRAYLIGVEAENVGKFEPTRYADSIQLAWSCQGSQGTDAIDIPFGVSQFVDVLKTHDRQDVVVPQFLFWPQRYVSLFDRPRTYRLTIQVAGEGVSPAKIRILFVWKGKWDDFKASLA